MGYHKFLKRRTSESATYSHKFPWVNFIRRKCDERGINWEYPRGQDYHIIIRWVLSIYMIVWVARQYFNYSAHKANGKPVEPSPQYPLRFNLPFYVYIIHEQKAPNFERYACMLYVQGLLSCSLL